MARKPRYAPGGIAYHVMNRTWGKIELFEDDADYEAFDRVLADERKGVRAERGHKPFTSIVISVTLCPWLANPVMPPAESPIT